MADIQALLGDVVHRNASDLHMSVGIPPAFRVDGELRYAQKHELLTASDMEGILQKLLNAEQREAFRQKKEYDFSFTYRGTGGETARFRGNFFHESGNVALALRLIPTAVRTIDQLELPPILRDIAKKKRGLFLVTGPTGHGKSSTLAAVVREINATRHDHIVTIEDPVEYLFSSEKCVVHQREVGSDTHSFAEALKRVLREDPDVIMIGEMRDLETVSAAITAAETGHLVLATLHTQDAAQSIDRIVDVFPPHQQGQIRIQLATILVGICSQQLIPRSGGGRVVATELLLANPAVRNCVKEGKTNQIKTLIQTGGEIGMQTMEQCLASLVNRGVLSMDVAMSYAYDPKDLQRILFEHR